MKSQKQSYLKSLQILFSALFTGQLLASLVFYAFLSPTPHKENNADLINILPLIAIGMIATGYFLFTFRRKSWLSESNIDVRKGLYRTASILKWVLFEGATLLLLIGYFILGEVFLLFMTGASLAHFLFHFPSHERLLKELQTDDIDG